MTHQASSSSQHLQFHSGIRGVVAAVGCVAVGLAAGYWFAGGQLTAKKPYTPVAAQSEIWTRINENGPVLTISNSAFAQRHQQQSNFLNPNGSRSDWVVVGALSDPSPYAVVQVARRNEVHTNHMSLTQNLEQFHDLRAARRRFGTDYYELYTRFGELRAVNIIVNADGVQKSCVGFHTPGTGRAFVKGMVCSPTNASVTPQAVACLIDSVRFVRPKDEESLKALLVEDEQKDCGASPLNAGKNPLSKDTL